jgi:class 3 adenylate cyclase
MQLRRTRILARAQPGEVLVSATVRDLLAGSGLDSVDRGKHALRGIEGARRLFALVRASPIPGG